MPVKAVPLGGSVNISFAETDVASESILLFHQYDNALGFALAESKQAKPDCLCIPISFVVSASSLAA
jgi:hypothetical protein